MLDLRPNLVSFGGEQTVEREERRGEEEEEEEEEEKKRSQAKRYGFYDFGMDITWKVRILWFCMEF